MRMKKEIMKRAWEIAKQGAKKFGGKAIEYIAEALKIAWNEVKTIMKIENEKIKVKYNEWKKYGKHRIYMDIEMSLVEIKNVKGNEVGALRGIVANYYYDVDEKKLYRTNFIAKDLTRAADEVVKYMQDKIKAKVNEIIAKFV